MRHTTLAAAAALLLASCGGGGSDDGEPAANGQAAPAGQPGGAAGAMQPGLWEMTVQMAAVEVPNMPKGMVPQIPATTARVCLTPEQAARPGADFFSGAGGNSGCTAENFSTAGGRIQGTVTCTVEGRQTRLTMDGRFGADSYELTQRSETSVGTTSVETETRITGRRVGDCPAG